MPESVLAIDFGASSGRGIIAEKNGDTISLNEIHRFSNIPVDLMGTLYWDALSLFHNVKKCITAAKPYNIDSIAIDTWGVDFALIDSEGVLMGNPVHYRDHRTAGMVDYTTRAEIERERLYEITGIEIMDINSIFQLESLQLNHASKLENADRLLFMPDFFNYLLCGEKCTEPSIASTSQILDAHTKQWSDEIIKATELENPKLPEIKPSGTVIGKLLPYLCDDLEIEPVDVILGCGHDTQCAIAAVPAEEKDFLFLSSGTWSLLGTELDEPVINEQTQKFNLSNETGFGGKTTLLKNIIGLWLVQESRRNWINEGHEYSFAELEKLAYSAPAFRSFIDPAAPEFQPSCNMPQHIREYCEFTGQPVPQEVSEYMRCIYESLAFKYRSVKEEIEAVTGKTYDTIYMVGGGCKDKTLAQFTANACGCKVSCGPIEATAFGNAVIQFIAKGKIKDITEARAIIRNSVKPEIFEPQDTDTWNEAYERFKAVKEQWER